MDTHIIIMAGGVGSRFWSMSPPDYPKQFIDVMGVAHSLIQLTVDRLKPICSVTLVINTSEYQRVLSKALSYTFDKNAIVTIGIKPPRNRLWLYRRSIGKDIRLYECKNCVVHAADESKVVVQGLEGYIVAGKNGQLLVCSLKEEQRIKEFGK